MVVGQDDIGPDAPETYAYRERLRRSAHAHRRAAQNISDPEGRREHEVEADRAERAIDSMADPAWRSSKHYIEAQMRALDDHDPWP